MSRRSRALLPVASVHLRIRVRHQTRRLPAAHVFRASFLVARAVWRRRRAQQHAAPAAQRVRRVLGGLLDII